MPADKRKPDGKPKRSIQSQGTKKFLYRASNPDGEIIEVEIFAESQERLKAELERQGLLVLQITETDNIRSAPKASQMLSRKVGLKDILVFAKQLLSLIKAGLSMSEVLEVVIEYTDSRKMNAVLEGVRKRVLSGESLSQAMKAHPQAFSPVFVNSILAGEESGNLEKSLERLITYLEFVSSLRKKIITALTYPILLTIVTIAVVTYLIVKVIPTFQRIFINLEIELPGLTKTFMSLVSFVRGNLFIILGSLAILAIVYKVMSLLPTGKLFIDTLKLKIPLFSNLITKYCLAQFTRTLAMLVASGMPLVDALRITLPVIGNAALTKRLSATVKTIESGTSFTEALRKVQGMPKLLIRLVSVGERTGELDAMLDNIATFLDEEIDTHLSWITATIEPVLMIIMGGVVAVIILAMFLPILQMSQVM